MSDSNDCLAACLDKWGNPMPPTCPECGEKAGSTALGGDWRCGSVRLGDTRGDDWTLERGYWCVRISTLRDALRDMMEGWPSATYLLATWDRAHRALHGVER